MREQQRHYSSIWNVLGCVSFSAATAPPASSFIAARHELIRGFWSFLPCTFFLLPLFEKCCFATESTRGDVCVSSPHVMVFWGVHTSLPPFLSTLPPAASLPKPLRDETGWHPRPQPRAVLLLPAAGREPAGPLAPAWSNTQRPLRHDRHFVTSFFT